ncbi:MAG: head GIN domain-containing protein [Dehalococcoidia bacterium]
MTEETMTGPEKAGERDYPVEGFTEVRVSNALEFEITQGKDYSVKATGRDKLLESLKVDVSGQTLKLSLDSGTHSWLGLGWKHLSAGDVKVAIIMPELRKLAVSGAARGTAKGFKSDRDFEMELSGASKADIDIEAGRTTIAISGAGRVSGELKAQETAVAMSGASRCELAGTASKLHLDSSGASHADLSRLQVKDADVSISGAGKARINMNGTLNVRLSGASSLACEGEVVVGQRKITGASSMTRG